MIRLFNSNKLLILKKKAMNRLYLLIFSLLFTVSVLGQSTFTPGWYIVEKGAFYSDYDPIALALGIDSAGSDDDEPFSLHIGEIVFVTEASGEIFYCFDPSGTPIILKGKNCLTKAPVPVICPVNVLLKPLSIKVV